MKSIKRTLSYGSSLVALSTLGVVAAPQQAQAQAPTGIEKILGGLLSTGGYWFTSASAKAALGSPKFYNQQAYYGHSAELGGFRVSGGVEFVQTSDHILPFSGGNSLGLYGVSARFTTPQLQKGFRPYISAGVYYGTVNSSKLAFNANGFIPSFAIGAEYKINRFSTLALDYRISGEIGGINTNGISLVLRIF
ncbi:MAG: hypothetical protein NT023_11675 [Armatimonadetes bacterium]|nr:hypothetical protein [Armatimonadota bacterium]